MKTPITDAQNVWVGTPHNPEAIDYIDKRIAYGERFRSKFPEDFRSGFSGAESGECCDVCVMRDEHFNGHADALKALVGCRNPFQLPNVCECHIKNRQVAERAIIKELENMRFTLTRESSRVVGAKRPTHNKKGKS